MLRHSSSQIFGERPAVALRRRCEDKTSGSHELHLKTCTTAQQTAQRRREWGEPENVKNRASESQSRQAVNQRHRDEPMINENLLRKQEETAPLSLELQEPNSLTRELAESRVFNHENDRRALIERFQLGQALSVSTASSQMEAMPPHTTSTMSSDNSELISTQTEALPGSMNPSEVLFDRSVSAQRHVSLDSSTRHPVFFTSKWTRPPNGVSAGYAISPIASGYVYADSEVKQLRL